jgi:hypothetical protein
LISHQRRDAMVEACGRLAAPVRQGQRREVRIRRKRGKHDLLTSLHAKVAKCPPAVMCPT